MHRTVASTRVLTTLSSHTLSHARTIAVRDTHLEFRILLYAANGTLLAKYQVRPSAFFFVSSLLLLLTRSRVGLY